MATITIQKKLSAMTEQIATAEQLEGVFNNPETYRKVCQIREASRIRWRGLSSWPTTLQSARSQ